MYLKSYHFANKGPYNQSYGFSSSPVQMWELDHIECWALKNWCFQTVVLEKTLKNPPDVKEIKPVNQQWTLIGRTDAEAPVLWPPDLKSKLIGKAPDAGKDWRQKEKGESRRCWLDSITDSGDMNLSALGDSGRQRKPIV